MSNEVYYFSGVVDFANITKLDKFGKYNVQLLISNDDLAKYHKSGIQRAIKQTDKGNLVTFVRKPFILDKKTNKPIDLGSPKIVDKNGEETDYFVNGGMKVVCKVVTYMTDKGVGHSLESIMLTEKEGKYTERSKFDDPEYTGTRF